MKPKEFITQLTEAQRTYPYLRKSYKKLMDESYVLEGESYAVNCGVEIPVSRLGDDIWFSVVWSWKVLEADTSKKCQYVINLSIPFFVGKAEDRKKHSIFRAEWDNYKQESERTHPQPHWHFTSVSSLTDELEDLCFGLDDDTVNFFWKDCARETIDSYPNMAGIHYAMSERWVEDGRMISYIDNVDKIAMWINSLLQHVKFEMQYVQK